MWKVQILNSQTFTVNNDKTKGFCLDWNDVFEKLTSVAVFLICFTLLMFKLK